MLIDVPCPHWNAEYTRCQKGVDCDCAQQCEDDYMDLYRHNVFKYEPKYKNKSRRALSLAVLAVGLGIWALIIFKWWTA